MLVTTLAMLLVSQPGGATAALGRDVGQQPAAGTVKKSTRGEVEVVYIPSGEFTMGSGESRSEKPVRKVTLRKVTLDGYWIGKNLVTVGQYRAYCAATGTVFPETSKPEWGWKGDHPMVNVNWDEARAYCQWAGGDLPTEAQWEKAARGTDGRVYPWGNEWDPKKCWCSRSSFGDPGSTAPVGSFPKGASPYGCLDMAGNAWQWCIDWFDESGYDKDETKNPTGPAFGTRRVLRGGSWTHVDFNPMLYRSAFRFYNDPTNRYLYIGFRLAGRSF